MIQPLSVHAMLVSLVLNHQLNNPAPFIRVHVTPNSHFHLALVIESSYSGNFLVNCCVEKRKISYFGLALNLFQHLISPNQDDLSDSARTFISGMQNGWAAKPTLFGLRRRPEQTFLWPSLLSDAC